MAEVISRCMIYTHTREREVRECQDAQNWEGKEERGTLVYVTEPSTVAALVANRVSFLYPTNSYLPCSIYAFSYESASAGHRTTIICQSPFKHPPKAALRLVFWSRSGKFEFSRDGRHRCGSRAKSKHSCKASSAPWTSIRPEIISPNKDFLPLLFLQLRPGAGVVRCRLHGLGHHAVFIVWIDESAEKGQATRSERKCLRWCVAGV